MHECRCSQESLCVLNTGTAGFSLVSPARDALGRPAPPATPRRREPAGRAKKRGRRSPAQSVPSLHRQVWHIRVPNGDRRPRRECARRAPICERRRRGLAQRTAEEHGDDGAGAQPPKKSGFQRSAFSFQPGFAGASHPSSVAATQRADGRHVRRRGAVQSQGLRPRGRTLLAVAGRAVADPAIAAPKCLAHWTGGCANRHRTPGNSCPKQKRAHDFRDVAAIRRG